MKKYLIILLMLPALCAHAITAREILDRTAQTIRAYGPLVVNFTATAYMDADDDEVMHGKMSIDGKKFRLESKGLNIWYDGKTEWSYAAQNGEVYITNPTADEMQMVNPLSFVDTYKTGYKLSAKKLKKSGNETYEVQLKANSKKAAADLVVVVVRCSDFSPISIRIVQDGQESRIAVDSVKGGQAFGSSHFTFNKSQAPKAEIIDLR